jgi:hypothetical protein
MSWAGIMTLLENNEVLTSFYDVYLTIWIKLSSLSPTNYLFIDIGQISEDIIPNNILNTDDLNANGILDFGEDGGLDQEFDQDEISYDPLQNSDPNNDDSDYDEDLNNFERFNFPENNNLLDTEDINNNYTLDRENNYYTYKIQLDTVNNKYISKVKKSSNWVKFKIPLSDYYEIIGSTNEINLSSMRFWFYGKSESVFINIAEIRFIRE